MSHNPFMAFVMEFKRKQGGNLHVREAVKLADPIWQKMSTEERLPYKNPKNNNSNRTFKTQQQKSTCIGTPISKVFKEEHDKMRKEKLMIEAIKTTIKNSRDIKNEKFYFIAINFFLTEKAIPAEIGLCEFSLQHGVNRKKHWFVNPKFDFYGMAAALKSHADATHQLPLPPHAFGNKESWKIYEQILEFIQRVDKRPPLYTAESAITAVSTSLEFLIEKSPLNLESLQIYSIQYLFYALKASIAAYGKEVNQFITNNILDKDTFMYADNISCAYHRERSNYCALSQTIRWGYTFADFLCKDFNIEFVAGKHMPISADATKVNSSENLKSFENDFSKLTLDKKNSERTEAVVVSDQNKEATIEKPVFTPPSTSSRGRGRFLGRGITILQQDSIIPSKTTTPLCRGRGFKRRV